MELLGRNGLKMTYLGEQIEVSLSLLLLLPLALLLSTHRGVSGMICL